MDLRQSYIPAEKENPYLDNISKTGKGVSYLQHNTPMTCARRAMVQNSTPFLR